MQPQRVAALAVVLVRLMWCYQAVQEPQAKAITVVRVLPWSAAVHLRNVLVVVVAVLRRLGPTAPLAMEVLAGRALRHPSMEQPLSGEVVEVVHLPIAEALQVV
jgi:hypothetical protein